jgi:FAD/FMN-containing dehydrogenase
MKKIKKLITFKNLKKVFIVIVVWFLVKEALVFRHVLEKPEVVLEKINISNDVTQLNPIALQKIYTPKNIEEVVEIIKNTKGKISIAGAKKSMGGQTVVPDGIQIDMKNFNQILDYSTTTKEITVQSGVRWYEIQNKIDKDDLSVMIMQSYNNFSVGGSISTNVHGRYIGYGPIIESVKSFRIVLANGEIVEASREKNKEIFDAVIGGFGFFGVITDITLYLADNAKLERKVEKVNLKDYPEYFAKNIRENKDIIFQNGDIYMNNFGEENSIVNSVSYIKTNKELTTKERLIDKDDADKYKVNRLAWYLMSEFSFGQYLREYILDPYMFRNEEVHMRNYEASYDISELEPSDRKEKSYVLQEYFIPVEKFNEFIPKMAEVFKKNNVNVLNVSIRHARKDEESLMSWAPSEVFAFVIYYKQGSSEEEKNKTGEWIREMTQKIIEVDGKYYLPYQPYATYDQFTKIYKNYDKFFEMKQKLDSEYRFSNVMWEKYYGEYLKQKTQNISSIDLKVDFLKKDEILKKYPIYTSRNLEQTFLTLPEWYMVYSYTDLADFLKKGQSQKDFDFISSIKNFWEYSYIAKNESKSLPYNFGYNAMVYTIGSSFTIEYGIKYIYENTVGSFTDFINGHNTEADKFIAQSWDNFAKLTYTNPWYEYHYFQDIKNIWAQTSFFERGFIRSIERKISFTISYFVKAIYAKILGSFSHLTFGIEENKTLSIVKVLDKSILENTDKVKILEDLGENVYLIETERYKAFSDKFLELVEKGVIFIEIMNHDTVALSYISENETEPFIYDENVEVLYKNKLSGNIQNESKSRVILKVKVAKLNEVINILKNKNDKFEMIYDY